MDIRLCLLVFLLIVGMVDCRILDLQAGDTQNMSITAGRDNDAREGNRVKRDADFQQNTTGQAKVENTTGQAKAENTTGQVEPRDTPAQTKPAKVDVFWIILYVAGGIAGAALVVGGVAGTIYCHRDRLHILCCHVSDSSSTAPLGIHDFNAPVDFETPSRNDSPTFPRSNRVDFTENNLSEDDWFRGFFPKRNPDNTRPDSPVSQTHSSRRLQALTRNNNQVIRMTRNDIEVRRDNGLINAIPRNNGGLTIIGNNNRIIYFGHHEIRAIQSGGQALPSTAYPAIGNGDSSGPVIEELP